MNSTEVNFEANQLKPIELNLQLMRIELKLQKKKKWILYVFVTLLKRQMMETENIKSKY